MKTSFRFLFMCTLLFSAISLNAQKGLPSNTPTGAVVHTAYPQHVDFQTSMLSQLKVPAGFKVSVAASGLGKPRIMAVTPQGNLYVTRRDQGDVLLLSDKDNDGVFDNLQTVWANFPEVHGITINNGWLYLCSNHDLKRGRIMNDGTLTDTSTLIDNLPDGGQHDDRTIAFGPDSMLYITVGSDCNDCKETNAEHATVLQVNPQDFSRRIYARGLRNTIGFDWNPQTKEMWGADNGTDWRGDSIPPEELNKIIDGGNYGWPIVYGKQVVDETREDPQGTTKEAVAKTTIPAVMTFPAHSAPIDLKFLNKATAFPATYQSDAIVTWHGSWNREHPQGYKVQRIIFKNGEPTGAEDFLTGFLSADGKTRFGRPAGIAFSSDGNIFISDDENGIIYKISYSK